MSDTRAHLTELIATWIARRDDLCRTLHRCDSAKAFEVQRCAKELEATLAAVPGQAPSLLPTYLTERIRFPIRWDGDDLLDATNRVIVWGKEDKDDRDDVDRSLGRFVADHLNALKKGEAPGQAPLSDRPDTWWTGLKGQAPPSHVCVRCHHRWTGTMTLTEYCGDCHRAVQRALDELTTLQAGGQAPPSPPPAESFHVYKCEEWQCRHVFTDGRCCGLAIGHEGQHWPASSEQSEILAWLNVEQKKAERWFRPDSGVVRFTLSMPELMRIRHALSTRGVQGPAASPSTRQEPPK